MTAHTILAIAVAALCTLAMRALPFLFFGKDRPMPQWLAHLGKTLPPAIMAVLVVYCLKDAVAEPVHAGIPEMIGVAIVAASYLWKHKTLPSIVLGTAGYMIALRLIG